MPGGHDVPAAIALSTDRPIVLLPVRLETKIDTSKGALQLLVRVYPDAMHVDSFEPELTDAELTWGRHFWEQTWAAGKSDAAGRRSAWAQLAEHFGEQRAAWIAQTLTPMNLEQLPKTSGTTRTPTFPELPRHDAAFTRPPYARALPDYWIALGYVAGSCIFAQPSNSIYNPLAAGPSPASGMGPGMKTDDPGAAWLVDFDWALKAGMGLRIPYALPPEAGGKLDLLLVVGVKSSTPAQGQAQLEELVRAHHHSDGIAFVPVGTPSNNTSDTASGFDSSDPGYEDSFRIELGDAPATTVTGSNRHVMARAFGVNDGVFVHVAGADGTDQLDAADVNKALWKDTWGYFLQTLMAGPGSPLSVDVVAAASDHFARYVRASGPLPALRIGSQPYGVLPVVSLDRLYARGGQSLEARLAALLYHLRGT